MTTYNIELACDIDEVEGYAAWLNSQGHEATVGSSTGTYIDGELNTGELSDLSNELWESFCASI